MIDVITRVNNCRPTLEADASSTPEEQFTFADDTDLVEYAIHNVLEDEGATVQDNATERSIIQRRRQMSEKRVTKRRRISVGFYNGKFASPPPSMGFSENYR